MKYRNTNILTILAAMFISIGSACATDFTVPHTFSPGTAAKSSEINENFAAIANELNALRKGTGASCAAIHAQSSGLSSGVYSIQPAGSSQPFQVYCDMESDGGGWTLVDKTDGSITADKTADAFNISALISPTLDSVAKLSDAVIDAIQGGTNAETRVESPALSTKLFITGTTWSVIKYPGYPTVIQSKTSGSGSYGIGYQCYDSDGSCSTDHYCFGLSAGEHVCIRRFNTAGIWFNGGIFTSAGYRPGRVWVR